jgi:hypothetical protein
MTGSQNWRQETDAVTFFGNQKKRAEIESRRPVIHKASDLAGPGIRPTATRITDFNDLLARYNGFFSALPDAANAPPSTAAAPFGFVGTVASDDTLGGVQLFTDLATGDLYQRRFLRSEFDPTAITWFDWVLV